MKRAELAAAERVSTFLVAARQSALTVHRGSRALTPQAWTAPPELFASGPEFAAAAAALQRLGGDLTADELARTGVAALLGSDVQFDPQIVGADLAHYAARGDAERLYMVGLNACDLPDGPVPVAGWELVRLGRSGVDDLTPVPAAARFMTQPGWDVTAAAATWWLRRSAGRKARRKGRVLDLSGRALSENAPAPLLTLALADDAALQPLSCYVVDRGVAVHRAGGEDLTYDDVRHGPNDDDVHPQFHDHESYSYFGGRRSQAKWPEWRRFCEVVGPMVESVYQKASDGHQGAERFTRAAGHFLTGVVEGRSHVLPQQRTVLELSVALEVLLVTGDSRLSKKFRDRVARLGGRGDSERENLRKRAEDFYKAGSNYRHGGELWSLYDSRDPGTSAEGKNPLDVAECRKLARRLLLHGLAVLHSGTSKSVADLCAEAQSEGWMSNVIDELYSRLPPGTRDSIPNGLISAAVLSRLAVHM